MTKKQIPRHTIKMLTPTVKALKAAKLSGWNAKSFERKNHVETFIEESSKSRE